MKIKDMPKFEDRDKMFDWLATNCEDLIYEAKATIKYADALDIPFHEIKEIGGATSKSVNGKIIPAEPGVIKARLIINTTNIIDSHKDLHMPGLWNKSLKENKRIKHKQEHGHKFKDIIADGEDLKAFTKEYSWRDLGYDAEGKTEALVFDSTIREKRNAEMYNEYKEGNVDNHSVGMQYVKMLLAMNSDKEHHAQYKINWDKYYPEVINKADADKSGYFFPILEAKVREGSAVPDGSNFVTPTLNRKAHSDKDNETAAKALKLDELKSFIKNL
jgi:hypothetical protein